MSGSNPDLDEAIRLRPQMESFLRQDMHTSLAYGDCLRSVNELMAVSQ